MPAMHCAPHAPLYLPRPRCQSQRGFTLIEVLVTVAILAVIMAIALPSFTPLIERWRVRGTVEDLQASLYFARSEAIKRGGGISLKAQSNDWAKGWTVEITNLPADSTENPVRQSTTPSGSITIVSNPATKFEMKVDRWGVMTEVKDLLVYPYGKSDSQNAKIRLCISPGGQIVQIKGGGDCPS